MPMLRKIATFGTAAVVALTLIAAPASAKSAPKGHFSSLAQIDCGDGPVAVGSSDALWAPLVDLRTGEKVKPVAWSVSGDGFAVDLSLRREQDVMVCAYDDGEATGTVTVKKA